MKAIPVLSLCVLLVAGSSALAQPAPAAAPVEVTFVSPEDFTDFRTSDFPSDSDIEHLMGEFRQHLVRAARPYLAEGQRLEVSFVDIDMAGDFEPWRGVRYHDVRIVKDLYPPRAVIDFRLLNADGMVAAEGRRELRNLGYLMASSMPHHDSLRHDKELLTDWLRREFKRVKK